MTFDLRAILIFLIAAWLYAGLLPQRLRAWALLVGSVVAIYWLQPNLPIRFSTFIFPTATLILTMALWWFSRDPQHPDQLAALPEDRRTLIVIAVLISVLSLERLLPTEWRLISAARPPDPWAVLIALVAAGLIVAAIDRLTRSRPRRWALMGGILFLITSFAVLNTEVLATQLGRVWRTWTGQDPAVASLIDLSWLGFSYVAFRLIHTLRDRQTGILPVLSLREYVTYVIFAPAFVAGPIDRAERFAIDYRALPDLRGLDAARFGRGGTRIAIGLLKKFVVADSLALGMSLTATNAAQTQSAGWLWVLLYGYALRLYFDFSGYTDIAIGLGILFGITLPENFKRPYWQTTLTAFWQSWHMTLSNWARFYVFTPFSRWLLMRQRKPSSTLIVLIAQLATMLTIGLWHGVTWNFLAWGLWHGVGLWVHKQWSDRTRQWYRGLNTKPQQKRAWTIFSWFVTLQFVVLGWVWFALPIDRAATTFVRLIGLGW
ncbi:Peptidoglycan O-acetyltransferase [Thermoflexales bacterium]|nr:Peptidoglycan O-acetyltransferase [Thermoflexales bacterium]